MNMISASLALFATITAFAGMAALYARNVGPILGYTHENIANVAYSFVAMLGLVTLASYFVPPFETAMVALLVLAAIASLPRFFGNRLGWNSGMVRLSELFTNMFLGTAGILLLTLDDVLNQAFSQQALGLVILAFTSLIIGMLAIGEPQARAKAS